MAKALLGYQSFATDPRVVAQLTAENRRLRQHGGERERRFGRRADALCERLDRVDLARPRRGEARLAAQLVDLRVENLRITNSPV